MNALSQEEFIEAFKRSPAGEKISEAAAREEVAKRRKLAEQLADVEKHATAEWPRLTAKIEAAAQAVKDAERALLQALQTHQLAARARSALALETDARRGELERELRANAHPAIAQFKLAMHGELDVARKSIDVASDMRINKVTGRMEGRSANNKTSIHKRVAAIMTAMDQADALALEPDQSAIPARLDELRATLPQIERAILA